MSVGHSVIAVPVPELETFVRERTARFDASFVSTDPAFVHAHVTLLAPWLDEPTETDLATVAAILASEPVFDFELVDVDEFPDGTLHLTIEPNAPLRRLTARLAAAFPDHPPYAGRYPEVVPHLTLDHVATGATPDGLRRELGARLSVRTHADRVDLQWWANHDCHLRHSWQVGR